MMPIQGALILLLALGTTVFLARLRATRAGRVFVLLLVLAALALVVYPALATGLAHACGVGRGVDLLIYLALLGQGFQGQPALGAQSPHLLRDALVERLAFLHHNGINSIIEDVLSSRNGRAASPRARACPNRAQP